MFIQVDPPLFPPPVPLPLLDPGIQEGMFEDDLSSRCCGQAQALAVLHSNFASCLSTSSFFLST